MSLLSLHLFFCLLICFFVVAATAQLWCHRRLLFSYIIVIHMRTYIFVGSLALLIGGSIVCLCSLRMSALGIRYLVSIAQRGARLGMIPSLVAIAPHDADWVSTDNSQSPLMGGM